MIIVTRANFPKNQQKTEKVMSLFRVIENK